MQSMCIQKSNTAYPPILHLKLGIECLRTVYVTWILCFCATTLAWLIWAPAQLNQIYHLVLMRQRCFRCNWCENPTHVQGNQENEDFNISRARHRSIKMLQLRCSYDMIFWVGSTYNSRLIAWFEQRNLLCKNTVNQLADIKTANPLLISCSITFQCKLFTTITNDLSESQRSTFLSL